MTWKNIKESLLTAASLVWSLLQIALSYLISCYQMVHAFGVYLYQRFFKKNLTEARRARYANRPTSIMELF